MNKQGPNVELHLLDGETPHAFVRRGIEAVFNALADELNQTLTAEELLGVPMALFAAETGLLETWDRMHIEVASNA